MRHEQLRSVLSPPRASEPTPLPPARERPRAGDGDEALSLWEPLLDAEQAAELLHVQVSWIWRATRSGLLPCLKLGRYLRYTRPMLEQWLVEHRSAGAPHRTRSR